MKITFKPKRLCGMRSVQVVAMNSVFRRTLRAHVDGKNILCLLRNECVPSFRLCASLFLYVSEGRKEGVHHLLNATAGRSGFPLLQRCALIVSSHRRAQQTCEHLPVRYEAAPKPKLISIGFSQRVGTWIPAEALTKRGWCNRRHLQAFHEDPTTYRLS